MTGNGDFASLILLSFNRKWAVRRSLESLKACTRYPYQLIVMDDASDGETARWLARWAQAGNISHLCLNIGHNQGIGVQMNRGFAFARGKYVIKLDADLEYAPGWLTHVTYLLDTYDRIGCLGLFKYWHQPCSFYDELIRTHEEYHEVIDFVGSAVCFRRDLLDALGGKWTECRRFAEDVDFKQRVISAGYQMALPIPDLATNFGFGEHLTSLIRTVDWVEGKHVYHDPDPSPLILGGEEN